MRIIMKKILVYLSIGVLAMGMTACANRDNGDSESTQPSTEIQTQESTGAEDAGNTEADNAGTDTGADGAAGGTDVTEGWSEEMETIKTAVVDALGENYWPNSAMDAQVLEGLMGITADLYDDYMGEMPMISTNVDTLLIIKAKDDKVEDVEEALNAYRENLVNDTMQYPMNLGKIQASRIERIGNYVCFVQLGGDTTEISESGEEAVISHCLEQNELAIEVIGQNLDH